MVTNKEKKVLTKLMEVFKELPHLYNKKDKNYLNKGMRNEALRRLLEIYKKYDGDATIKTLKKKLLNMRSNFRKELKKVLASKQTASSKADIYVPTLWYFDTLKFLSDTTISNPGRYTTDDLSGFVREIDGDESVASSKNSKQPTQLKIPEEIFFKANELAHSKEDDLVLLGRSISHQLKEINKRQLTISRKLISDALYYGSLNRLDEDSRVVVRSAASQKHTQDQPSSVSRPQQSPVPASPCLRNLKQSPRRSPSPYDHPIPFSSSHSKT